MCVLRHSELTRALHCVWLMAYGSLCDVKEEPSSLMHGDLVLAPGSRGGLQVVTADTQQSSQ